MKAIARLMVFACVPVFLLALSGCSGKDKDGGNVDELKILGSGVMGCQVSTGQGPASADDLKKFLTEFKEKGDAVLAKVKSGDYVVVWGFGFGGLSKEEAGKPGDHVIAYEKDVPNKGGHVVMSDMTIKKVTAEEFKGLKLAPKAKQ